VGCMGAVDGLRAETEMDKFCSSHCCTSDVRLGQGRVRVSARARPAVSLSILRFLWSSALTLSEMSFFVLPDFCEPFGCPVS